MNIRMFMAAFFPFALLAAPHVHAAPVGDLQAEMKRLKVLPLHYGINELKVNGIPVAIIRAAQVTGDAGGRDGYIIIEKQEDAATGRNPFWQFARQDDDKWRVLNETFPHTGDDSIISLRFMIPKGDRDNKNISDLYLFRSERKVMESYPTPSQPTFTLSMLGRENNEAGILFFNTVATMQVKDKYCNVDWPAYKLLNVPLPDDKSEYSCENK